MGDEALMKEKKQKKSFPIWVIAAICLVAGLIIAAIVFFVLVKISEAEDLRKIQEKTDEIFGTRTAVEKYLNAKSETVELSEENKAIFAEFEDAVDKAGSLLKDLGEIRNMKDGDGKEKYEAAAEKLGNLQKVSEIEQLLMDAIEDGALSDEELDQFTNADSEYLKNLAKDYKDYRTKVAEFNEKYADLKGKNKAELDADYAKIQQDGNDLAKKYAEIKFDDVYGMSRDDILKFYATIEELNNHFSK
jgi:uncharacterized membrane-anchored protein YhcB (DUF1043 family)